MSSWISTRFGSSLLHHVNNTLETVSSEVALSNKKFIGVYFSAQWCGPCRRFTPLLAALYDARVDKNEIDIVFVSSDEDTSGFSEYFNEMPWYAVPFESPLRETMGEDFGVAGIPTLVILDGATGEVVTNKGRDTVVSKKAIEGVF